LETHQALESVDQSGWPGLGLEQARDSAEVEGRSEVSRAIRQHDDRNVSDQTRLLEAGQNIEAIHLRQAQVEHD
jgi:hypothetical protein